MERVIVVKMKMVLLLLIATKDDKLLTKCQVKCKVLLCIISFDPH